MKNKDTVHGAFPKQEQISIRSDKEFVLIRGKWDEYLNAMIIDGYFELDPNNGEILHLSEKGFQEANYS